MCSFFNQIQTIKNNVFTSVVKIKIKTKLICTFQNVMLLPIPNISKNTVYYWPNNTKIYLTHCPK